MVYGIPIWYDTIWYEKTCSVFFVVFLVSLPILSHFESYFLKNTCFLYTHNPCKNPQIKIES